MLPRIKHLWARDSTGFSEGPRACGWNRSETPSTGGYDDAASAHQIANKTGSVSRCRRRGSQMSLSGAWAIAPQHEKLDHSNLCRVQLRHEYVQNRKSHKIHKAE